MQITLSGARYHVERVGQGTPLLMLHGFTGRGANWHTLAAQITQEYAVEALLPDLLGHGQTDSPADAARYSIEAQAADLVALLDALDVKRALLWGYSMGGRLALYTALHDPSRFSGLILESASPGLADADERAARVASDTALAARIRDAGIAAFVEGWEKLPLWASQARMPQAKRDALRAQRLENHPDGLANSLIGMGTGAQPALWDSLAGLALPVLLMAGALDTKFTAIANQMQAKIGHAHLEIAPYTGHAVHFESPAWAATAFGRWAASLKLA